MRVAKICYIVTGLDIGGTELQLYHLIKRLNQESFSPVVISMLEPGTVGKMLSEARVPVYSLGMKKRVYGLLSQIRGMFRLYRIVHREKPDLLVLYLYHAIVVGRLAGRVAGVRRVISCFRTPPESTLRGRLQNLVLRATSWADAVTTVNSETVSRGWLEKKVMTAEKVRIIPNGVIIPAGSRCLSKGTQDSPAALHSADSFVWLAIGRLNREKDFFTLIEAFKSVTKRSSGCKLCIVGEGPLRQPLEEKVRTEGLGGHVVFTGACDDVHALFSEAQAFVLSSAWEGMPNVILEAMATGLPVVATDIGGVPELVKHGQNGLLVPPRDPVSLAEAMLHIMTLTNEERGKMGQIGMQIVRERYDIDLVKVQWEGLYDQVING